MNTIFVKEVESTNLYAKSHIEDFADRTVLHALSQTAGRGRMQRKWVDFGHGNLFMSLILKPSENFDCKYSNLTQYLSIVLCKVLEEYGLTPQIKWPNDVLINGKKIAGILAETVISGNKLKGLVIGLGVNLVATQAQVDSVPDKIVTSLNLEIGRVVPLQDFLYKVCGEFFLRYDEFLEKGYPLIKEDYLKRACFLGKEISVKVFNEEKHGLAKSVTDNGELILTADNKDVVLTIGDIL